MQNNPTLDFYTHLRNMILVAVSHHDQPISPEIDNAGRRHMTKAVMTHAQRPKGISFPVLYSPELMEIFFAIHAGNESGIKGLRKIAHHSFVDLSTQIRGNTAARNLVFELRNLARVRIGDVRIHVRGIKNLGEGMAQFRIVTDDLGGLKEFLQDPAKFLRHRRVSYSEAVGAEMKKDSPYVDD